MLDWLSPSAATHRPILLLLILFITWKATLFLVVVSAPGPGYDTSTTLLKAAKPPAVPQSADLQVALLVRPVFLKFIRWDAIYFTTITNRGHVFEQEWAFGVPLISAVIPGRRTNGLLAEIPAAILLSHCAHLLSVLLLYGLSKNINCRSHKADGLIPFIAAALHIFCPAGVFLSAPYPESLFSFLNVLGFYLYLDRLPKQGDAPGIRHCLAVVAAGLVFGCATIVRSNGLLSGLPFLYDAVIAASIILTNGPSTGRVCRLLAFGLGGALIAAGAVLPQYEAYQAFCVQYPAADRRPWCKERFPSVYRWVQSHYWNVGLFRYWTVSNVPLFLLAAPCLWLLSHSALWVWRSFDWLQSLRGNNTGTMSSRVYESGSLCRLAMPQFVLAVMALTSYHVQIITRLASGYPLWYIWLATMIARLNVLGSNGPLRMKLQVTVRWMIIYAAVQGGLFAAFLPPA